ncbi:MAG: D-glycero-beta-D-manno-heptose 1,7-bisphosphate 7-phosphatase [Gammaproteobacteria bacterium]|nr:D-glycero-beta-D-manno-heptose 1,7-bisphosphate 7-phosphatase [Gammaproteobacteria bacterium]
MKLIILDRDGVINQDSDDYIKTVDEWQPITGSLQAMGRLSQAGYTLVVATNQSGIARGYFDLETLHAMHKKMDEMLEQFGGKVDAVFYCPHGPKDNCQCRKPAPGLFHDISSRYQVPLANVVAIGDSLRDIQAAREAGARPILVKTGKGERSLQTAGNDELDDVPVYENLAEVVDVLLAETNNVSD